MGFKFKLPSTKGGIKGIVKGNPVVQAGSWYKKSASTAAKGATRAVRRLPSSVGKSIGNFTSSLISKMPGGTKLFIWGGVAILVIFTFLGFVYVSGNKKQAPIILAPNPQPEAK